MNERSPTILKRIFRSISLNVWGRFTSLFQKSCHSFDQIISRVYPEVSIFEGLEKDSNLPIIFAFAGSHAEVQEYWAQAVFAPGFRKLALGRHFFMDVFANIRKNFPECVLLLMESNGITRSLFYRTVFYIPEWVEMEMDIAAPMERLLGSRRAAIEDKIRESGLSCQLTHDHEDFDDFYHTMYVPYAQRRRGAIEVEDYWALYEIFLRGELLLVKKGDEVLGAGLFEESGHLVYCRKFGIRGGNCKFIKEGVIDALYYFLINEMKKRGCKKINLGATRPLLTDSVVRFQISLKAQTVYNRRNPCVSVTLLKDSPALHNFLIHHPFLTVESEEDAYRPVFFRPSNKNNEEFSDMVQSSICHGLEKTDIFVFDPDLIERSNYFFSVKPAWTMFDYSTPYIREKKTSLKLSWIKRILHKLSVAGG